MTTRVLIIEDEPLVALDMVACAGPLDEALDILNRGDRDVGCLRSIYVNLRGESEDPVAVALRRCGKSFLFVSGCGRTHCHRNFLTHRVSRSRSSPAS